jgi:hypothetical protein
MKIKTYGKIQQNIETNTYFKILRFHTHTHIYKVGKLHYLNTKDLRRNFYLLLHIQNSSAELKECVFKYLFTANSNCAFLFIRLYFDPRIVAYVVFKT